MRNKILVVDDSRSAIAAIKDVLEGTYEVTTAFSGEEGLTLLQSYKPDLILLDVVMPGIDGYEVCRRIRASGTDDYIKILMVSTEKHLEARLKGYEVGADDYVIKPFERAELLAKVQVFLRLKTVEDQLQELNKNLNEQVMLRTQQLIDAEKMAVIGRYAAGIVHNLSTPLQVIMGRAQLLSMTHSDDRHIMELRKAAAQMKQIVGTILNTCRKETLIEQIDIDLNDVIAEQLDLLKSNLFFKHKVTIDLKLNPLPRFRGIYAHFSQSIGNLIKNAFEAMYDSEIRILTIESNVQENTIVIRVSDTGRGIPPSIIGKIFNPFFTTKPLTAFDDRPTGTGLGLASSQEMIASYGGEIQVASELDKGSTFTVILPLGTKE